MLASIPPVLFDFSITHYKHFKVLTATAKNQHNSRLNYSILLMKSAISLIPEFTRYFDYPITLSTILLLKQKGF